MRTKYRPRNATVQFCPSSCYLHKTKMSVADWIMTSQDQQSHVVLLPIGVVVVAAAVWIDSTRMYHHQLVNDDDAGTSWWRRRHATLLISDILLVLFTPHCYPEFSPIVARAKCLSVLLSHGNRHGLRKTIGSIWAHETWGHMIW